MLSYVTSSSVLFIINALIVAYEMNFFVKVFYLNVGIFFVCAQNDGRYRPASCLTTKKPIVISDGRYKPSNDGRYNPLNDGKYRPNNDGKYVHIGDKDRGLYSGGGGEYTGSGGQYTGGSGQYTGGDDKYRGNGAGSGQNNAGNGAVSGQNNAGNGAGFGQNNAGNAQATTAKKPQTTITPKPKPTNQANPLSNGNNGGWKILRDEKTDGYHYLYETENGILAEESGRIENLTPNEDGLRSKGFYQYTGDDGVLYRVDYVADHNGFVPQGDHIPKTLPAIQKLLDYLASKS